MSVFKRARRPAYAPPHEGTIPPAPVKIPMPPQIVRQLPYGIEGKFRGFCAGCDEMETVSSGEALMALGEVVVATTTITCKHFERCGRMAASLKSKH